MLATSGGFVAICPKKEVELGADKLIHRADHAEELRQEIEFPCSKAVSNQYAYLCGGALRAINPNSSMTMAESESCAAVFKGNLFNKAELAMQLVGCPSQLNEAQLLLHLYSAAGLDMLGRLQGQYAFCLYDSKQARVLAARDHSGAVPLVEGRTAAGSLIIACGTFLPEGVHQMVDIQPGEYKYGWHALPRQFKCGATKIVSGRASCEYGIRRRSIDAFNSAPSHPTRHSTKSLDIPSKAAYHSSSSGSQTPGRYVPPHAAGGAFGRQRAISLDSGHWGTASPRSPALPSPHAHHPGGKRTSENGHQNKSENGHQNKSENGHQNAHGVHQAHGKHTHHDQQQQQQRHMAKATPSTTMAAARVMPSQGPAAAAKAAAAALAAAAAATSAPVTADAVKGKASTLQVCLPEDDAKTGAGDHQGGATPGADLTNPTKRRSRKHRHRKGKAGSQAQGTADHSTASSDTESTCTHDSTSSHPVVPQTKTPDTPSSKPHQATSPAAGSTALPAKSPVLASPGAHHKAQVGSSAAEHRRKSESGGAAKTIASAKPATAAHGPGHPHGRNCHQHEHRHKQQQWLPKAKPAEPQPIKQRHSSSGSASNSDFKRNNSCGELAGLGSSPTTLSVLQTPAEGLAC